MFPPKQTGTTMAVIIFPSYYQSRDNAGEWILKSCNRLIRIKLLYFTVIKVSLYTYICKYVYIQKTIRYEIDRDLFSKHSVLNNELIVYKN